MGTDPTAETGLEFPIGQVVGTIFDGERIGLFMNTCLTFAAMLSMIGLFMCNSQGWIRIPFALAEDRVFPRWFVKVHPRYGPSDIPILVRGYIYWFLASFDISTQGVADHLLQMHVILAEIVVSAGPIRCAIGFQVAGLACF